MSSSPSPTRSSSSENPTGSSFLESISQNIDSQNITNERVEPYIHPTLQRSTYRLSQDSLNLCTDESRSRTSGAEVPMPPPVTSSSASSSRHINISRHLNRRRGYFPPPLRSFNSSTVGNLGTGNGNIKRIEQRL